MSCRWRRSLTGILGLRNNLGQQLGEVGQILAEEAGLEDQGLSGVRRVQLATKEFGFAGDTESRSSLGILR